MVRDPKDPGTRPMPGLVVSTRDRQAAFKARQKAAGKHQRTWWVTPEQEVAIQKMIDSPQLAARRQAARERAIWQARSERNRAIVEAHKKEIIRRQKGGEKQTAIAKWLVEQFAFEGNGATLNNFLAPSRAR